MNRLRSAFFGLAAGLALPALAGEPGAHVHGSARLEIAVDADTLTLRLESPLDNLLGFEHLPRNDKERAAVRAMADKLQQAAALFAPTPAAQCQVHSVKLESPVLEPAKKAGGDGHTDLDGEFVFRCARPEALRDLEVGLFQSFPHLRRLDAQVAGPRRQVAMKLTPQQRRIAW
jgi:uncharacterized protein DUF2796